MTDEESVDEQIGELFSSLAGERRVKAFQMLADDVLPKEIADEIGITRQGLQRYIDSWKEAGLIKSEGNDYILTTEGRLASNIIFEVRNHYNLKFGQDSR